MAKIKTQVENELTAQKLTAKVAESKDTTKDGSAPEKRKVRRGSVLSNKTPLKSGANYKFDGWSTRQYDVLPESGESFDASYYEDIVPRFKRNGGKDVVVYLSTFSEGKMKVNANNQLVEVQFPFQEELENLSEIEDDAEFYKKAKEFLNGKLFYAVAFPFQGARSVQQMWCFLQEGETATMFFDGVQVEQRTIKNGKVEKVAAE